MQPLEEVDGVSEAVVAQGQVIPSDAIAAGDAPTLLLGTCTELAPQSTSMAGSMASILHIAWTCLLSMDLAQVAHYLRGSDISTLGTADGASQSMHIRTGPLLNWALDYSGTMSVLVQTETAWYAHCPHLTNRQSP